MITKILLVILGLVVAAGASYVIIFKIPQKVNNDNKIDISISTSAALKFNCPVKADLCQQAKAFDGGQTYLGLGFSLPAGVDISSALAGEASLTVENSDFLVRVVSQDSGVTSVYKFRGIPEKKLLSASPSASLTVGEVIGITNGEILTDFPFDKFNLFIQFLTPGGQILTVNPRELLSP